MASTEAVDHIINSLAFKVEAVPHDEVLEVSSTSKTTPLNLKIRVRKREDAQFKQGVVSVPKIGQPKKPPERVRLVSSDQTVLSFKVFVDTEPAKKIIKKRKSFFGGCLSSEDNDDDAYVISNLAKTTKSGDVVKLNFGLSKTVNNQDMQLQPKKPTMFFGNKCKPGGCLDPPFGEDKYSYVPKSTTVDNSIQHYSETKKVPQQNLIIDTLPIKKGSIPRESLGKISSGSETKKGEIQADTTSIQSILPPKDADSVKSSLDTKISDSIITYPPNETADHNEKESIPKRISDETSFQDFRFSKEYYSPSKSRNNSDAERSEQKENGSMSSDRRLYNNKKRSSKPYPKENSKQSLKPCGDDTLATIHTPEKDFQKSQSDTSTSNKDLQIEKDGKEEDSEDTYIGNNDENQMEKKGTVLTEILGAAGAVTGPLLITEIAKQITQSDKDENKEDEQKTPSSEPDATTEMLETNKDAKESLNETDTLTKDEQNSELNITTSIKSKDDDSLSKFTNPEIKDNENSDIKNDLIDGVQSSNQTLDKQATDEDHIEKDLKIHEGKEMENIDRSSLKIKPTEEDNISYTNIDNDMKNTETKQKDSDGINDFERGDIMKDTENNVKHQQKQQNDSIIQIPQNSNEDRHSPTVAKDKKYINGDFENSNKDHKSISLDIDTLKKDNENPLEENTKNQDTAKYLDTPESIAKPDQQSVAHKLHDNDENEEDSKRLQKEDEVKTTDAIHHQPKTSHLYDETNMNEMNDNENINETKSSRQKSRSKPSIDFQINPTSRDCDFVNIDLAFHSYQNDQNECVIKSLDNCKDFKRRSQDNVTIIKFQLKLSSLKVIKVPIDNNKCMMLEFRCNSYKKRSSSLSSKGDTRGIQNDENLATTSPLHSQIELEVFQNLLSTVYEHQLLPLQGLISALKKDVEKLAVQQLWLKDNWNKSIRAKMLKPSQSIRKCICYKK